MTGGLAMEQAVGQRMLQLFCSHLRIDHGSSVVSGPFPYESSLIANAIQFGMSSTRQFDGTSIRQPTQTDWSVGFVQHSGIASDHKALSWVSEFMFHETHRLTCNLNVGHPIRPGSILYGI
jgi:hypothetical protein